jgi:plastocyanin
VSSNDSVVPSDSYTITCDKDGFSCPNFSPDNKLCVKAGDMVIFKNDDAKAYKVTITKDGKGSTELFGGTSHELPVDSSPRQVQEGAKDCSYDITLGDGTSGMNGTITVGPGKSD